MAQRIQNTGGLVVQEPFVAQDLRDGVAALGVGLEHMSQEVGKLWGYIGLQRIFAAHDQLVELLHVASFERHSSVGHREKYDSGTPDVDCEAFIAVISQYFRGDVGRSATLFGYSFALPHDLADPEVADLRF